MPQIWLTYDELADMIGCDVAAARATACTMPLDRRKCHDGNTRAKLNAHLTEIFFDRLLRQWIDREITACAGGLRELRELMTTSPVAKAQFPRAIAG